MELETWHLLLLPLFFALGWLAARVDMRDVMKESRAVPESYFKGLSHLLNEQPDQAIESFLELAQLDPDTLDLHFALGALFRRRGEVDRALRVHQNLVDRTDLDAAQRQRALYELGQDYHKAGMLDRAEATFSQLQEGPYAREALQNLQQIFVLEKEWARAADTLRQLAAMGGGGGAGGGDGEIAHYLCEQALNAIQEQQLDVARSHLAAAIAVSGKSVRACILLGDMEAQAGDDRAALVQWKRVEQFLPAYLPLVAERIFAASQRLGEAEAGLAYLRACLDRHASADLAHVLFSLVATHQGWAAARTLAAAALLKKPDLLVLDDWLQAETASDQTTLELRTAQDLVHRQASAQSYYQCRSCGFKARQHFWQCPACARWETLAPERLHRD